MLNNPPSDEAVDQALTAWLQSGKPSGELTHTIVLDSSGQAVRPATLCPRYRFTRRNGKTRLTAALDGIEVSLDDPVLLEPVAIPKPWGREIWHSAVEIRGESRIVGDHGTLPLSHYLALAPERLCRSKPLVLLKTLDPNPEPVLGELYLEVHAHKREVYVVTHVDARAWPAGQGYIRFGVNQALRREFADDESFRGAFLAAVNAYRATRTAIDSGEPIDPDRESDERAAMGRFTELRPLGVGDVVVVPTWLPHSLQHGVRVVEFQTPVYERYIISFTQEVLTQDHWDSETAITRMTLEEPAEPDFVKLDSAVERIAGFADFNVCRATLAPGAEFHLPQGIPYALCMSLGAGIRVGPLTLDAEQACFVPHSALVCAVRNTSERTEICLVAAPEL